MRHDFSLNRNILETNLLNLLVVFGIVVTIVGDTIGYTLEDRRARII